MTREIIAEEVDSADFFAVIADETTDVSVQNQLTVILRYVAKGKLYERFTGFYNVTSVPGCCFDNYLSLLFQCHFHSPFVELSLN